MKKYFVTAIGTDSGKTLVSAILTHALQADYWKPVQTGMEKDADVIASIVDNLHCIIHEEAYHFELPASPHAAAAAENKIIQLKDIKLPETDGNPLVIEGAGGALVPLNDEEVVIDIAKKFDAEIILVSNHYLGSINHTMLTIEAIRNRGLKIKGIIFNGEENKASEDYILRKSGLPCLLRIKREKEITQEVVFQYSVNLFQSWHE